VSAVGTMRECRHNDNDVIMIIAGLWRYGDWQHVAMDCNTVLVIFFKLNTTNETFIYYAPQDL